MTMEEKRKHVLEQIRQTLAKRGIVIRCPKCNGNGFDAPCAYPDFNYRDCPVKHQIKVFGS